MLPGDFDFGFKHDFIDVLVELKSSDDDSLIFAAVKVADHFEEFSNVRDYQRVCFLDSSEQLIE